ncbi:hypothetical protein ncot_03940 [Nocardioides sp. JQ2195]|uniref:hypothetical protein n=1 Tax=Nocardioides sp. JQ2195 TaxID=2592334 RepID=UPI00143E52A5|nr:hypothetical protein [Nocardioides sp. JQ2195]QIX25840.1 hypothetical protein ncot_03940 [Nocardioides sp. JQ2195]
MNGTDDPGFDPGRGRHPVNTGHLVMGLVFAGLVGIWALVIGDVVTGDDIRWLLPIPWVAGGAIGLAAATYANVRSRRTTSPADHPAPATETTWMSETDDTDPTQSSTDDTETTQSSTDDTDPTEEIR